MAASESYPEDLKYHREHDWARIEGDEAVFGITWKAQDMLGELVFFQPPLNVTKLETDALYGEVESVKAGSDLVAPLAGEVIAVNDAVQAAPETINSDPYGAGWLVRVRLADPTDAESLLDAAAYAAFVAEQG